MESIIEHVEHPFARGSLTADGVQFSDLLTTTTDDYEEVEKVKIDPPVRGAIQEFEFGLTCAIQSSSTLESVLFKWQARQTSSSTWVDLHTEITYAADASALKEYTYSGRVEPQENLNAFPLEIRLMIKSGGAGGETAKGKTKNSSYVKVIYRGY